MNNIFLWVSVLWVLASSRPGRQAGPRSLAQCALNRRESAFSWWPSSMKPGNSHMPPKAGFFSLGQKNQPVSLRTELKDGDRRRWFFGGFHRQGALGSGFASCAHIAHGAYRAIGVFGQADTSAQVHQRLVEIAGPCARNQRLCFLADGLLGGWRADGNREVEEAAHDTQGRSRR